MEDLYSWTGFVIIWSLISFVSYCALALVSSALLAWIDLKLALRNMKRLHPNVIAKREHKRAHFHDRMACGIVFFIALVISPRALYRAIREEESFWDAMDRL